MSSPEVEDEQEAGGGDGELQVAPVPQQVGGGCQQDVAQAEAEVRREPGQHAALGPGPLGA